MNRDERNEVLMLLDERHHGGSYLSRPMDTAEEVHLCRVLLEEILRELRVSNGNLNP